MSAIFCAIEEDNLEGLQKLMSMASIDINQTNKHGECAVHIAAGFGRTKILRYLSEKGSNLGLIDNQGDSAIVWAARQGYPEVIKFLVSKGVHLNQLNKVIKLKVPNLIFPPRCNSIFLPAFLMLCSKGRAASTWRANTARPRPCPT